MLMIFNEGYTTGYEVRTIGVLFYFFSSFLLPQIGDPLSLFDIDRRRATLLLKIVVVLT